ncbi:hypothetical protein [Undibacterium sp. Tian12W]|uniref:hypothetical protein n=1 Tax=Undibacterium sp. Tian12W TaxID=3413054 RepID=UPI003BF44A05
MKRRDIGIYIGMVLAGSLGIMSNSNAQSWVIDDAETEIMPIYTMTHTDGQEFTFVRAGFWFHETKKSVKLSSVGVITVNGIELKGEQGSTGTYSYVGNIPVTEGILTFKLVRNPNKTMEHSFKLPTLDILDYPKSYTPYETIKVLLKYAVPAVDTTTFNMYIRTPQRTLDLNSKIRSDYLEFSPIIKVPLPTGTFEAKIYKQERTPLKDISDASKIGWGVASNGRNFKIEILDAKP